MCSSRVPGEHAFVIGERVVTAERKPAYSHIIVLSPPPSPREDFAERDDFVLVKRFDAAECKSSGATVTERM